MATDWVERAAASAVLRGHGDEISKVIFSPDELWVVTPVRVWSAMAAGTRGPAPPVTSQA